MRRKQCISIIFCLIFLIGSSVSLINTIEIDDIKINEPQYSTVPRLRGNNPSFKNSTNEYSGGLLSNNYPILPQNLEIDDPTNRTEGYDIEIVEIGSGFQESNALIHSVNSIGSITAINALPTADYYSGSDPVHYAGNYYSFQSRYQDPDGASNLDDVYAAIGDANNDICFRVSNIDGVPSSGTASIVNGQNYLVGSVSYSRTPTTNGYLVQWTYKIDWDWDHDDIPVIDYWAMCTDDQAGSSGWDRANVNGNYENDLKLLNLNFQTDDATGNEDGTVHLTTNEWFRGGIGIRCYGQITYEGTTNVYPPSTDVMAQLWTEGIDRGDDYDDAPDGSGSFTTPYYTTPTFTGLDTTYFLDITLQNIPSGGSEGTGVAGINVRRDNEIPTATSYTHADSNTGTGYDPNDGYDDDLIANYTVNSPSDGFGCGLHATAYAYEWNDGGFGSYTSDSTPDITVADDDSADSDIQIRDKVNNVATIDGEDIVIDDDAPTSSSITESRVSGYPTNNAYLTGTTIYYDTGDDDYFTISIDSSTVNNSGLWKTEVDVDALFTAGMTTNTSALPNIHNCAYLSGDSGTLRIRVVNNAGNYEELTYTATSDNTAPTIGTFNLVLTADTDSDGGNDINPQTSYYDDNSVDVTKTGTPTETGSGLPTNCYSYKYNGGSYQAYVSGEDTITSVPDGAQTIYVRSIDNVGNIGSELDSVAVHVELNTPTQNNPIYEEISQGEYLYNPTGAYLYYANHQAVFNLTSDYTASGGSGYYGVRFTDAFDLGANTTDTSTPYEWQYEVNIGDSDTVLYIILYNNAGNSHQITVTLDKDTTDPTGTITDIAENSDFLYNASGTTDIWYGDDMPSGVPFTVTIATHNDDKSGIWKMVSSVNLGESVKTDYTSDYTFIWTPTSGDTDTTQIDIYAYDNVNNYQIVDSVTVHRDTTVDIPTISSLSESSESLHTNFTALKFWYSEVMGSTDQELTITIGATDAGGSGVYAVEFPTSWGSSALNDTVSTYERIYYLSSADTDTGTVTMLSYDNVGNTDTIAFTTYKDTIVGSTTFDLWSESSFYIYTSGSTLYFSDESFTDEIATLRVTPADQGSNPSGTYKVLFGLWEEQSANNDTASDWERDYTFDGDDSAGTITVKMYDNVGNLESSLVVTITRLTDAPVVTITDVDEDSEWLHNQSLTQFYYGDDMSTAQELNFTCSVSYAGADGILKTNSTVVWFGDSPTDSSDPYLLTFTIENTDTDSGTLTVIVWTNTGKNGTDTITITRDTTNPVAYSLSSPDYDGDGNVTVTGSTTDVDSGMRTSNVYEWWVNATRDFGSGNWTNTGSYEFQSLPEANHTFYAAAYDFVGNWQNATVDWTIIDFTAPEIYCMYLYVDNNSQFYLETTNNTQQTLVIVYYNPTTYTFEVFLNFTAWDVSGGSIVNVTYNTRFGDSPDNDTGDGIFYNATYTIPLDHSPEDANNGTEVVATAVDNVGLTTTVSIWFYRDLDAPTCDYIIDEDEHALVIYSNHTTAWENDTIGLTIVSNWQDGDHPPNVRFDSSVYLRYKVGAGAWSIWGTTESKSHTLPGAGDTTVYVEIRDRINNTNQYEVIFKVDLTYATIDSFYWIDPQYGTQFYQSSHSTAQANITWSETNIYLVNVSCSTLSYSDNDNSPSDGFSLFNPTITGADSKYYNFTSMAYDKAGNRIVYTTTGSNTLYIDDIDPAYIFELIQDPDATESNWYNDSTVYVEVTSYDDGVNGSGVPSTPYMYRLEGGWYGWMIDTIYEWNSLTEGNHTFYAKARDNLGNEIEPYNVKSDWAWVDLTYPILNCLTLNETYAPNWYDQSVSTHAGLTITWTEDYPYNLTLTVVSYLAHTNDLSPSGGTSDLTVNLTGASDGAYILYITIYDNAGNSDTTLIRPSIPIINLLSGMSSSENEHWYYFYFFRSDGIGLDWNDFNSSYVLNEDYEPYTEVRFRGDLYAQKFLNDTSSIRIITRDYFGNVVYNQSFTLPTSRDKYITLDVYTFKVVNLYDEIMNMTIKHITASTYYTEQITPYETFRWDLYASIYNITVYIHESTTIAEDENGNMLDDYQVDLSSCDVAIFINARQVFHVFVNTFYLTDENVYVYISSTKDGTYYIYENESSVATGSFFEYGTTIQHTRNSSTNIVIELCYQFINGTDEIWFNTTYSNPLSMLAATFIESESNQYFEYGVDELVLNWTIDQIAFMIIWLNGSYRTHNSGTTYIETTITPYLHLIGVYNFTVEAINQFDKRSTSTMFLTVRDTIPPTFIEEYTNGTTFEDARVDTTLTFASGESVDVEIYRNTTLITSEIDVTTFSGTIGTCGEWNITVIIEDNNGNSNTSYLVYHIQDTTAPEFLAYETTMKTYVGSSISQKWSISDLNPKNYTITLAGIVMDTGTYTSSVTFSHTFTSAGTYTLALTVEDDYGNTAIASTIVTVELPDEGNGKIPIYPDEEEDDGRVASGFELIFGILALVGITVLINIKKRSKQ